MTQIAIFRTASYACSYLSSEQARSEVVGENINDPFLYSLLSQNGFRRSGKMIYRPACDTCHACKPIRIPVGLFSANRSQQRTWQRNQDLKIKILPLVYQAEHYALYQRYQATRHTDGDMKNNSIEEYSDFILNSPVESRLVTFYLKGTLCMVSLVDYLQDGLSAVYTFFDPDLDKRSLGVFNILWQIQACQTLGLEYCYLGYWIKESRKMAYKTQYKPYELLNMQAEAQDWELFTPR